MDELSLFDLPHRHATEILARGVPVWLPINPVEYHGPHLSLHNDRLISTGLARATHRRLIELGALAEGTPFVLASDLEVGVDPTPGPGTRAVSREEASAICVHACRALVELGARRVIAMTWHGSPLHAQAIESGLAVLRAANVHAQNPFNQALRELTRLDGSRVSEAFDHIDDRMLRAEMIATLRNDFHAGFFETSLSLHYAPESVLGNLSSIPPCPKVTPDPALIRASSWARRAGKNELADELRLIAQSLGWLALEPFPGYTGAPSWARAEAGAIFAKEIEAGYATLISEVLEGKRPPPSPPMAWVSSAQRGRALIPVPPFSRSSSREQRVQTGFSFANR